MVDDISDTSKNKLTIEERREIVEKVGKELGLQTELEFASQLVSHFEETTDNDDAKNFVKDFLNLAEKRRDGNLVAFLKPTLSVELIDDHARIRAYALDFIDDSGFSDEYIEEFYERFKDISFASLTFRDHNIDFSMIVPRASDEYFEQVIRMCLEVVINIIEGTSEAFNVYKNLFHDD